MTIGSAKTALMAATGIQTRRAGGESRADRYPGRCAATGTTPAAASATASTGTKSRKAGVAVDQEPAGQRREPASRVARPAATDAIATTNAR